MFWPLGALGSFGSGAIDAYGEAEKSRLEKEAQEAAANALFGIGGIGGGGMPGGGYGPPPGYGGPPGGPGGAPQPPSSFDQRFGQWAPATMAGMPASRPAPSMMTAAAGPQDAGGPASFDQRFGDWPSVPATFDQRFGQWSPTTGPEMPATTMPPEQLDYQRKRAEVAQQLRDPAVRDQVYRTAALEDPKDPQAQFESIINRAIKRGQPVLQAATDPAYYPQQTIGAERRGGAKYDAGAYDAALDQVLAGSDITRGATGNASANVGFGYGRGAGDPYTYRSQSGERYAPEAVDTGGRPPVMQASMQPGGAQPRAPGAPPRIGPDGMPQFDLMTLAQRINQANPNASPQVKFQALMKAMPMLEAQSKQQLAQLQQEYRNEMLRARYGLPPTTGTAAGSAPTTEGAGPAPVEPGRPYNFAQGAPDVEKGQELPAPAAVGSLSSAAVRQLGENWLLRGNSVLSAFPIGRGGTAQAQENKAKRDAVINYGTALAQSRGMSPQEVSQMQLLSPRIGTFIVGQDGRATTALGTVIDHLDTYQDAVKAWNAGDYPLFNQIAASIATATGQPEARTIDALSHILGVELEKALAIGGAGTQAGRDEAAGLFNARNSPAQSQDIVYNVQRLLAGQLDGKHRLAQGIQMPDAMFQKLVGPRGWQILTEVQKGTRKGGGEASEGGEPAPSSGWGRAEKVQP